MTEPKTRQRPSFASRGAPPGAGLPAVVPAAPTPGPRRRWLWLAGGALVVAVGIGAIWQPWVAGPAPVVVEIAALAPVTRVLAVNGRIAARHSVDVRAQASGLLEALSVDEGDTVAEGAELGRVDASTPRAGLRQAVAGRDAALVAQNQARDAFSRAEAMGDLVSRSALDGAARGLQAAAQEVARQQALVDQAQVALDRYTLRAPIAGSVLALNVEPGQSIDAATVLMTLADLGDLIVETDVDEAYATQIRPGLPAVLQLTGEADTRPGRVDFVSQRVDAATGGLALRLAFDAPVSAPIGLTVTTNIVVEQRDAALTVPRSALVGEDAVFLMIDGLAQRRAVEVIDWPAARLIVTEGLEPGDAVIVDATDLAQGQAVQVETP